MGVLKKARRSNASAALVLLLAMAGSTSSVGSPAAAGGPFAPAPPTTAPAQPVASLTVASRALTAARTPGPAVHVARTGTLSDPLAHADITDVLLESYRAAAAGVPASCHLPVSLLAAIGEVESGSLADRQIDARHRTSILGPVLDGHGFAAVPDTDGGKWDGNATWDRAMGPMQFVPSTWRIFGVDGDRDGVADPQDIEDASAATAGFLCYGGRDLADPTVLRSAVLAYNHSTSYRQLVLTYQQRYARLGLDQGTPLAGLSGPVALQSIAALGATPVSQVDPVHRGRGSADVAPASAGRQSPPARTGTAKTHTAGSHTAGSHTAGSHTAGSHTAGSHTAKPGSVTTAKPPTTDTSKPTTAPAEDSTSSPNGKPDSSPTGGGTGTPATTPATTPASTPSAPDPTCVPSVPEAPATTDDPDATDGPACLPCSSTGDPASTPAASTAPTAGATPTPTEAGADPGTDTGTCAPTAQPVDGEPAAEVTTASPSSAP